MFAGRPIIGLAGGIGAGKSHVARLLESFGCCRVDSDEMIRAAYTHPSVKRAVAERFGEGVLDEAGQIDRRAISAIVFREPQQRQWLEQLLHPIANTARVEVMSQAANDDRIEAYVWDSPLLFETRLNELCDVTVFVDAPRADRVARVAERGWDEAELDRREKVQLPLDKKRELADYRLSNANESPATAESVQALLHGILERFLPPACACGDGCCRSANPLDHSGDASAGGGCGCRSGGGDGGQSKTTPRGACCGSGR